MRFSLKNQPFWVPHGTPRPGRIESPVRPAQLHDARTVQTGLRRAPHLAQDQGEVAAWGGPWGNPLVKQKRMLDKVDNVNDVLIYVIYSY